MAVKPASPKTAGGKVIHPTGWPRPRGFANGMAKSGTLLAIGGQIGAVPPAMNLERGLVAQFGRCLDNVLAVVQAAGGRAQDLVSMTIYVTDQRQYHAHSKEIGAAWRARMGKHYPAMALVQVAGLIEPRALVEIQALAVL